MSSHSTEHASKASLEAMKENDSRNEGHNDAVPGGPHARSAAAHESGPHAHTKPAENERALITEQEEQARLDRGRANNRGAGAGLRGNSGKRGE